ncbi:MAG: hypothetical protein M3044_19440 [Thermoproteota archaeon]|nr:hypothetical protein [Thermoproteota archaeon]
MSAEMKMKMKMKIILSIGNASIIIWKNKKARKIMHSICLLIIVMVLNNKNQRRLLTHPLLVKGNSQ